MIRRYPTDSATSVIVAQGRVSVGNTVLGTGMRGIAKSERQVDISRNVEIASALSWVDGELVLDEIPLRQAVVEMQRWYGMKIVVRDSVLLNKRVITTLGVDGAREALELIATALGARVSFFENQAVFTKQ